MGSPGAVQQQLLLPPTPTVADQPSMYGLTLWQPWAWLVSTGAKPVENRPWAPPEKLYGQHIALHAGMRDDANARATIVAAGFKIPDALAAGAIIGTARVVGLCSGDAGVFDCRLRIPRVHVDMAAVSRFFFGPFGWVLDEIVAIDPVPCRGFQRLWGVPPEVLATVRDNYARAAILAKPVLPASVRGMPL